MSVRLPLFPLGSVLVPGLVLPLHIFEPRYRVLVEALMALPEEAPRHFGVVALRSGREVGPVTAGALYPVGCTAELREVTPYSDGRFDIVGVGEARFRIDGIDDGGRHALPDRPGRLPARAGRRRRPRGADRCRHPAVRRTTAAARVSR